MKISSKGQVTIPQHIREDLGLVPHTEVELEVHGEAIVLTKAETRSQRGKALVERMRGRADAGLSTRDHGPYARRGMIRASSPTWQQTTHMLKLHALSSATF